MDAGRRILIIDDDPGLLETLKESSSISTPRGRVLLEVRDTGPGIAERVRAHTPLASLSQVTRQR
jgi:signal transduction histidine kinase